LRHRRLFAVIAVAVGTLVFAAAAQAWVATLIAPTHTPKVGSPWPIKVGAHTKSGRKLHASAYYAFRYQGKLVKICKPLPNKPGGQYCTKNYPNPNQINIGKYRYKFYGGFRDTVVWPKDSLLAAGGIDFRVVIHKRHGGNKHVDYLVKPHL
jgi:hypothetical protein